MVLVVSDGDERFKLNNNDDKECSEMCGTRDIYTLMARNLVRRLVREI